MNKEEFRQAWKKINRFDPIDIETARKMIDYVFDNIDILEPYSAPENYALHQKVMILDIMSAVSVIL